MALTLPFGLVFEMPVVVFFLAKVGIIDHEAMARNRSMRCCYLVLAAALPRARSISQTMMAVPMCIYTGERLGGQAARPKPQPDDQEAEA